MRVFFRQIYVEPRAVFPFSHKMQLWMGERVSALVEVGPGFVERFGVEFRLGVNISARTGLDRSDVRGPTVFRKTKDVEYSLFLPYGPTVLSGGCRSVADCLVDGVVEICERAGVECRELRAAKSAIVEELCTNPIMLTGGGWVMA